MAVQKWMARPCLSLVIEAHFCMGEWDQVLYGPNPEGKALGAVHALCASLPQAFQAVI